jgi:hypothetical protein
MRLRHPVGLRRPPDSGVLALESLVALAVAAALVSLADDQSFHPVNDLYTFDMGAKKQEEKEDDPAMTRVRAVFADSGLSLVELGRRMGYADETARQAVWQFMRTGDPRVSMLRKFADAMGLPVEDMTPRKRRKRVARKLEAELAEAGSDMDPKMFVQLLEERHATMHANWTVDDLVCHPDEAKTYCEKIRSEVGAPVPDHVILRRLMNARKAR